VTALFDQKAGITMQHVPYRGGAPAILSVVQGDTQFAVISPLASLPHIQSVCCVRSRPAASRATRNSPTADRGGGGLPGFRGDPVGGAADDRGHAQGDR